MYCFRFGMNAAPGELGRVSSKSIADISSARRKMILGFEDVWAGAEIVRPSIAADNRIHRAFSIR
jgi:hypothetical protein